MNNARRKKYQTFLGEYSQGGFETLTPSSVFNLFISDSKVTFILFFSSFFLCIGQTGSRIRKNFLQLHEDPGGVQAGKRDTLEDALAQGLRPSLLQAECLLHR